MSILDKERLTVSRDDDGSVTWTLSRPLLGLPDLLPCGILAGLAAYALKRWGFLWEQAGPLGAAFALLILLLQGFVEPTSMMLCSLPTRWAPRSQACTILRCLRASAGEPGLVVGGCQA